MKKGAKIGIAVVTAALGVYLITRPVAPAPGVPAINVGLTWD